MFKNLCLVLVVGVVLVQFCGAAPAKGRKTEQLHHNGISETETSLSRNRRAVAADIGAQGGVMLDPMDRPVDSGRRRNDKSEKHQMIVKLKKMLKEQGKTWEELTPEERQEMKKQMREEDGFKTQGVNKGARKEERQQERQQAQTEERSQAKNKGKGRKPGKKGGKKGGRFGDLSEERRAEIRGQIIAIKHDSTKSKVEKKTAVRDILEAARQA